jgi:PAS domain S-box-containing protein
MSDLSLQNSVCDAPNPSSTEVVREAKSSDREHTAFFENAPVGLHWLGSDGVVLRVNQTELDMLGYSREEFVGQHISNFHVHRSIIDDILDRLARGKRIHDCPAKMRCKDGSIREVLISASVLFENGKFIHTCCFSADVTERKQTEQRLRTRDLVTRALAESRTIDEAAPRILAAICEHLNWQVGGIWLVDDRENVLRCVDMYHLPSAAFPRFEAISRERTFAPGIGLPGRVWADGRRLWLRDVVKDCNFPRAPVAHAEGLHSAFGFPITLNEQVLGVIEFFSHEIRQPVPNLLDMMAAIGSQVGQFIERRRAELALRESEKSLREADRRKDEFLATLAHELRNPLAPIRTSLQLLHLGGTHSSSAQTVLEMMERQVDQMVRLVDDLMEVSRITRGLIELRKEDTDLATLIRGAVESSKPLIESREHQLLISLPCTPVPMHGDPVRLGQVFANLLNNAAKYTKPGGRIWIKAEVDGGGATISVKDNGIGLSADMLPLVFDMFMQVDRSTNRAHGGLGIGLTLAKNLVELHGGAISVKSDGPGNGSEFVVRLPVSMDRQSTSRRPALDEIVSSVSRRRVLVVDDNRDAAATMGMLLNVLGADVDIAFDGAAALAAVESHQPDVVLLDLGMPGMDGYEVARRIRENPSYNGILLTALTGWGQREDRSRTQLAGFDHHLVKPVDVSTLQSVLAKADVNLSGKTNAPEADTLAVSR